MMSMSGSKKFEMNRRSYANGPANGHSSNIGKGKPKSNRGVPMDGVYGNHRFSHGVTSLIGCVVQVEVKNGSQYEGVFHTFSPKMEIVLQMAHRINCNQEGSLQKDEMIDAIIFKAQDVVTVVAANVDLDYASKDTFTDSAISKFNGEVMDRELERWDGDGPGADLSLESDVNGWGVEEMFKTNAEKYNVKSSYDAKLSAYTTPLEVDDSAEGQAKQARAAKLAREIEQSTTYQQQVELENQDEDENISAVIREAAPRDQSARGVYIPPHLRQSVGGGGGGAPVIRNAVNTKPVSVNGAGPNADGPLVPQPAISSGTNVRMPEMSEVPNELDKNKKNVMMNAKPDIVPKHSASVATQSQQSLPSSPTMPQAANSVSAAAASNKQEPPINSANSHRPLQHSKSEHSRLDEQSEVPSTAMAGTHTRSFRQQKSEHRKGVRDDNSVLSELKDFSDNFNLSTDTDKEKRIESKTQRPSSQPTEVQAPIEDKPPTPQKNEPVKTPPTTEEVPEKKKSTLNPNAKEFTLNPNAREFKPTTVPVIQNATSPRPQTQSPVIQQAILNPPVYLQSAYMPIPAMMASPGDQHAKRAVVSVRPDPNSAQAQALAGPPLQAQPAAGMPGTPQYTFHHHVPIVPPGQNMPHTYNPGQGQMYGQQVVLPNHGPRVMNAQQVGAQMTQMAQYPPQHHQQMGQIATMNVAQHQMFIQGPGGISQHQPAPQMMPPNQPPNHHHHPSHYVPHHSRSTPPQQTSHPQQQQQPQQPPQTQPTGQPAQHPNQQQIFHPNGQVPPGSQPPLQPSPHTPASPQAQPPVIPMSMSYTFSQPPVQTHTQNPAMHQMAANYMQVTPQVTYTAHHAHGPAPQNPVMMIQQPTQHIQGQPHHLQHAPQMPPSQMQGHVHMSQSGHPMGTPQMGPMPTGPIHYAPQPSPR